MKLKFAVLVLPLAAASLCGCEAMAVVNVVSAILSPESPKFAPTQSGPFRERTATDDMSPVLNEVANAEATEKCKEHLKKLSEGPKAVTTGDGASPIPGLIQVPDTPGPGGSADLSETGRCRKQWVCLPAQDQPLLTMFCPTPGQDVVESQPAPKVRRANYGDAWNWN